MSLPGASREPAMSLCLPVLATWPAQPPWDAECGFHRACLSVNVVQQMPTQEPVAQACHEP
eukprot:10866244-Lingulodinium_polyedra.AAC.1